MAQLPQYYFLSSNTATENSYWDLPTFSVATKKVDVEDQQRKILLYREQYCSLPDPYKDCTTMEITQENIINSLTALFTQPHLAPVQVDTPKGKVTLWEYITMIITGQYVLLTDPELERVAKAVKVDPMFEAVLSENPHYDRKSLELLAAMVVGAGLVPENTNLDISKPLSTYMPLTTEGFESAVLFNAWFEKEFPTARKVISADPIANCLADLASALKEVKLAPTKVVNTKDAVLNAMKVEVAKVLDEIVVQAQAEVKKVVAKAPRVKKETTGTSVAGGAGATKKKAVEVANKVPQHVTRARKAAAVGAPAYDPFAE